MVPSNDTTTTGEVTRNLSSAGALAADERQFLLSIIRLRGSFYIIAR